MISKFWNWFMSFFRKPKQLYSKGPLPREVIRKPPGGCGIHGCPNKYKHSHANDLMKKWNKK